MLTIISIEKKDDIHDIQSQSHRTSVWLDGYIEVPSHLIEKAWESCGYCNLILDEDGNLADIELIEKPVMPEPEQPADITDELAAAIKEGVNSI